MKTTAKKIVKNATDSKYRNKTKNKWTMKTMVSIFIVAILCGKCLAQKNFTVWKVENVKKNYVQKGFSDEYELPLYLKGKHIRIQDSLLVIAEIKKNYIGSSLSDEFGDTIILKKNVFFRRQKDDEYTLQYPGDELEECILNKNDTCFVSGAFLTLLEENGNGVNGYISSFGKHSKTKCILFILKKGKEVALYSENDFLLLFFSRNK